MKTQDRTNRTHVPFADQYKEHDITPHDTHALRLNVIAQLEASQLQKSWQDLTTCIPAGMSCHIHHSSELARLHDMCTIKRQGELISGDNLANVEFSVDAMYVLFPKRRETRKNEDTYRTPTGTKGSSRGRFVCIYFPRVSSQLPGHQPPLTLQRWGDVPCYRQNFDFLCALKLCIAFARPRRITCSCVTQGP